MILCSIILWVLSIQHNLLDIALKTHAMHYVLLKNGKQKVIPENKMQTNEYGRNAEIRKLLS